MLQIQSINQIITKVAKQNSGVVVQNYYMTCKNKRRPTTVLVEILFDQ